MNGNAEKYIKIDAPDGSRKLLFIPDSYRLLIYEYDNSQTSYEYNLMGKLQLSSFSNIVIVARLNLIYHLQNSS